MKTNLGKLTSAVNEIGFVTRGQEGMNDLLTQVKRGEDVRNQAKRAASQGQKPPLQPALDLTAGPPLLRPLVKACRGLKTLILDVDETLVHSSFNETD